MGWLILMIAGMAETAWLVGLKLTHGFTRPIASVITLVLMGLSLLLLSQAVKTIHIGTAYAIWVGIGASGAFIIGMLVFDEPRDPMRIACVMLIVMGIVGLKFAENSGTPDQIGEGSDAITASVQKD